MPRPVIQFVLLFGAGLATGLARFPAPLPVALGLGAAVALRGERALIALGGVLGFLHGAEAVRAAARSCPALLRTGPARLRVRLLEPGRAGVIQVAPEAACHGPLRAVWPPDAARPAGATLEVRGRWVPRARWGGRPDGLLVVRAAGEVEAVSGAAAGVRARVIRVADSLYGRRAPIVEALVLGRRGDMDPRLREAFTRSGLVHLLSISGFHVGLMAVWLFVALRLARADPDASRLGAAGAAVLYVAFLGWPAPATRAAGLVVVTAWSRLRQRNVQVGPLLAVTCLGVLLVEPWAITEPGAWLSASAIWGVTRFTRWSDRALGRHWGIRTAFASLGASLATAPITAAAMGTVAVAGIVLNFAAVPLAGIAVPGVFASLVVGLAAEIFGSRLWGVAEALAAGSGLALAGLERIALLGGAFPWASLLVQPGAAAALPWLALLGLLVWSLDRRFPGREAGRRLLWSAALALWVLLVASGLPALGGDPPGLTLYLLDVGQGDAAAIRTPSGRWVVIDAGPSFGARDAGRRVVAPFLTRMRARQVDMLVVSHAHLDHLGGAAAVLDRFVVNAVLEPAVPVADSLYLAFLDDVAVEGAQWRPARRGEGWTLDGVRFSVLHPDTTWTRWREDLNEDSVVLLVEYGAFRALFTGDAGLPVEAELLGTIGPVDILKVGHHGSRGATGSRWLGELRPRAALISVGGANRYGHPHREALSRLADDTVPVWRTDEEGTLRVWTDGAQVVVRGKRRREAFPAGGG